MNIDRFMLDSWNAIKQDKAWIRRSVTESGQEILEQYENCFGKAETLETIIKGYPYAPIPAKSKKEFKQNCAQIIIENLDDLNSLLGTKYAASKEEIYGFLKIGIIERIIGERHDPHWLHTIISETPGNGAYHNPRTGNICFQNRKNVFAVPKERMNSIPHETGHKILSEMNSSATFNLPLEEGICTYAQNTINGKYSKKADLDNAITCFNHLDYGASLADEEKRRKIITHEFQYFRPFPHLKEKDLIKRNAHCIGYATVLYAVNNQGECIIRELVGEGAIET